MHKGEDLSTGNRNNQGNVTVVMIKLTGNL